MRALVQERFGGPETLPLRERPMPQPGPGEVVVEVAAAGLDAGVVHLLEGRPAMVRLSRPGREGRVLGSDLAGRVHALGQDVEGFAVGDEVFGLACSGDGSLAEFARARADRLHRRPDTLGAEEAAALPVSGCAALHAVRDAARVRPGQRVLVLGAAGGVGHLAAQIARADGAAVTGACSTGKVELVRELDIAEVIDHTREDPLERGPFDAIIDTGGHRPLRRLRSALTPTGALVIVGSEPERAVAGGLGRSALAALLNPVSRQRLVMLVSHESREDLAALLDLVESGRLRPTVSARYPLERGAEALASLGRGRGTGKVVVTMSEP
ncbi:MULTISPECIES: NAD(P)-dependent alcohol dehydrogenase [unclassified Brachybacterium]|uniref:NAD(P)-dependent alcohol dehydrogenase n=1 Tax=unclassified Brachybacterium TaxID=2623841 RepID=UPI003621A586